MKTKCKILGKPTKKPKNLKEIVFEKCFDGHEVITPIFVPDQYSNIELICINYHSGLDLIFAYYHYRNLGMLYLGKWNDGIVNNQ